MYAINFCDQLVIDGRLESIKDQEHYFDFAHGLGMKNYDLQAFSHLAHRLQHSLPDTKEKLSRDDINQHMAETVSYLRSRSEWEDVKSLRVELETLEETYDRNELVLTDLRKSAKTKALAIAWLGSSVVIGQFAFIAVGTFHYLSWDIMEPMSYLMMLGNFTAGFAFYGIARRDLEL